MMLPTEFQISEPPCLATTAVLSMEAMGVIAEGDPAPSVSELESRARLFCEKDGMDPDKEVFEIIPPGWFSLQEAYFDVPSEGLHSFPLWRAYTGLACTGPRPSNLQFTMKIDGHSVPAGQV